MKAIGERCKRAMQAATSLGPLRRLFLGLKLEHLVYLVALFSLEPYDGVEFLVHRWE